MLILPILIPIIFGSGIALLKTDDKQTLNLYVFGTVTITTVFVFIVNFWGPSELLDFGGFGSKMTIAFKVDGLSRLFSTIAAILWPLASLYAFEYMENEKNQRRFFSFYTITYGVTLAIAYSANFLTIYLFYELLTLATLPLVIHGMNQESFAAGRKYIYYSISGATLIFICLVFIVSYGDTMSFRLGGVFSGSIIAEYHNQVLQAFFVAFFGIGVKAALFPLHAWLISAAVAPTTVTALLHAVAVVKAGVFFAMRLTYYVFDASSLQETWVQYTIMALALITILYGSARAWYTSHFKRRLAYSTVSQLSYILFGVALMSPKGLAAAMIYMLAHSFIKITLFYCCGAAKVMTHRYDLKEMEGLGRYMPVTFTAFTVMALALIGLPPAAGFVAKLQLLTAITQGGNLMALGGITVFFVSMMLTAAYMFSVVRTAYFPKPGSIISDTDLVPKDPSWRMTVTIWILVFMVMIIGIAGRPLLRWLTMVSLGLA